MVRAVVGLKSGQEEPKFIGPDCVCAGSYFGNPVRLFITVADTVREKRDQNNLGGPKKFTLIGKKNKVSAPFQVQFD